MASPPVSDIATNLTAPSYHIPDSSILAIEHPCFVKNTSKAIDMIGGAEAISAALQPNQNKALHLNFNPLEPTSKTIVAYKNASNNVLLKITVPKRTGRKRKRGSNGPFVHSTQTLAQRTTQILLQSLHDNPQRYTVQSLGRIENTQSWRSLPDFTYTAQGLASLDEVRSKLILQQYPNLTQYSISKSNGLDNTETIPPPVLSSINLPQNYTYHRNTTVRETVDPETGKKVVTDVDKHWLVHTYQCTDINEPYPDTPLPTCPPLSSLEEDQKIVIRKLETIFAERPLWTRRALANQFPSSTPLFLIRQGLAYVAFAIRSGPWRDTMCKFGIDPRTESKYRTYQTILLNLVSKAKDKSSTREEYARMWQPKNDKRSHIFYGNSSADALPDANRAPHSGPAMRKIPQDGKVWQLCDLLDPQLKTLVESSNDHIRSECENRYFGWYLNGTFSKIRVMLKAKIDAVLVDENSPLPDSAFKLFLTLPETVELAADRENPADPIYHAACYLPPTSSKRELEWASAFRQLGKVRELAKEAELQGDAAEEADEVEESGNRKDMLSSTPKVTKTVDSTNEEEIAATYAEPDNDDADDDTGIQDADASAAGMEMEAVEAGRLRPGTMQIEDDEEEMDDDEGGEEVGDDGNAGEDEVEDEDAEHELEHIES